MHGLFERHSLVDVTPMPFKRIPASLFLIFCFECVLCLGCVTRTERISPYERAPKDESVWDEIRREFGGRDSGPPTRETSSEPFYKRAARGVKETVSGWFHDDSVHLSEQEIAADRRHFEQKRTQALEQLREQQEEEIGGKGE